VRVRDCLETQTLRNLYSALFGMGVAGVLFKRQVFSLSLRFLALHLNFLQRTTCTITMRKKMQSPPIKKTFHLNFS